MIDQVDKAERIDIQANDDRLFLVKGGSGNCHEKRITR